MKTKEKEEIILCGKCTGKGIITKVTRTDAYDSEDVEVECPKCFGSGRLKVTTTIVTVAFETGEKYES